MTRIHMKGGKVLVVADSLAELKEKIAEGGFVDLSLHGGGQAMVHAGNIGVVFGEPREK